MNFTKLAFIYLLNGLEISVVAYWNGSSYIGAHHAGETFAGKVAGDIRSYALHLIENGFEPVPASSNEVDAIFA